MNEVVLSVMFVTQKQWHGKTVIESCAYYLSQVGLRK